MKKQFYENLCIKDFTNNISENEKKTLNLWLRESDQNTLLYNELKNIWLLNEPSSFENDIQIEDAWNNLKMNLSNRTQNQTIKKSSVSEFIASLFAPKFRPIWAMSIAVILIISSFLVFNNSQPDQILKTISTKNGERLEVQLSDGSIVTLNNDSEIQFDENFAGDKRDIKLKGEAFFSVKKDGRPFIIKTENAITSVLGTKFNVWSRSSETRVLVKEGKVSLAENIDSNKKVYLTKGELSTIINNLAPTKPSIINADLMLGWMDGKLVFESTSLFEIAKELQRHYDVIVTLESQNLSELRLTGSFENETIDSVLTKICLALNINYTKNKNNYSIKKQSSTIN